MNVYSKLASARVKLQEVEMNKSGYNKHLDFHYPELQDFLPHINKINEEVKIVSIFYLEDGKAFLNVVDSEKEESLITFKSDVAEARLQGKPNPIQELGSQHTYMRRYLYMMAYEISMPDAIDKSKQEDDNQTLSEAQIKRLNAIAYSKGYDFKSVFATANKKYGINNLNDLTKQQYEEMCNGYENAQHKDNAK